MTRFLIIAFLFATAHTFAINPSAIKDPTAIIDHEIIRLDDLIKATEQSLEVQKRLKGEIIEYQKAQNQFLANPKDNEQLLKVVKAAHKTLRTIKDNHLEALFDADFIDELTVLSQPAAKKGIPKP